MSDDYQDAPEEILILVASLLTRFPDMDACNAKIKFLVKSQEKSKWAGRCHLTHGPWKYLSDYDYVIIIWKEYWESHNRNQQQALLYHELLHVARTEKDTWALRQHPIQEFPEVVNAFGCWSPELACLQPIRQPKPRG